MFNTLGFFVLCILVFCSEIMDLGNKSLLLFRNLCHSYEMMGLSVKSLKSLCSLVPNNEWSFVVVCVVVCCLLLFCFLLLLLLFFMQSICCRVRGVWFWRETMGPSWVVN